MRFIYWKWSPCCNENYEFQKYDINAYDKITSKVIYEQCWIISLINEDDRLSPLAYQWTTEFNGSAFTVLKSIEESASSSISPIIALKYKYNIYDSKK